MTGKEAAVEMRGFGAIQIGHRVRKRVGNRPTANFFGHTETVYKPSRKRRVSSPEPLSFSPHSCVPRDRSPHHAGSHTEAAHAAALCDTGTRAVRRTPNASICRRYFRRIQIILARFVDDSIPTVFWRYVIGASLFNRFCLRS